MSTETPRPSPGLRPRSAAPTPGRTTTIDEAARLLRIEMLGADGDGVAFCAGERVFVAGALPGEIVSVAGAGRRPALKMVRNRSPVRTEPSCSSFEAGCGGCTLQHMRQDAVLAWKAGRVAASVDPETSWMRDPPVQVAPHTRRRMALGFARDASSGTFALGLARRGARSIVDMVECHVLEPALLALLAPVRALLPTLVLARDPAGGTLAANRLDHGADLLFRTRRTPDTADRTHLARFATDHRVCRISWVSADSPGNQPETLVQLAPATIRFAGRTVEPPPGAFLQAAADGESAIVAAVLAALDRNVRRGRLVIELHAGCGTLTLPIAEAGWPVRAFEGDPAAVAALVRAASGTRARVALRDLARSPLSSEEFGRAAAIVLDPPYDGVKRQIEAVAVSGVPVVVLVSCNPAALTREAAALRAAGYRTEAMRVIDQFLWSARVESVTVFVRP